jgi:predicted DNA-binding protein with PD1-like motif
MESCETKTGRSFVLRLFDGEVLHETIEAFSVKQGIRAATVIAVGGADTGSRLVVGPEGDGRQLPVKPMIRELEGVHELTGNGTIFTDERGAPVLHMHASCGREGNVTTGCVRAGVKVWCVMEVVLTELTDCPAVRRADPETGFALLRVQ